MRGWRLWRFQLLGAGTTDWRTEAGRQTTTASHQAGRTTA